MYSFTALLVLAAAPAFGTEPTLYGLAGAELVFENIDSNTASLGLSGQSVRTSVELHLRRAGFLVLPLDLSGAQPYLHISITTTFGTGATAVIIELRQPVVLKRMPSVQAVATTWNTSGVISRPTAEVVRDMLDDYVDQFLNDWLAANPVQSRVRTPGVSLATQHQ
jgi:hypothetical protein